MGYYSIILPLATTNLVTNPSFELATTGWTAQGGSIARSTTYQKFGAASLAVTPTSGTTDGTYFTTTINLVSGTTYTFSLWIKGVVSIPYQILFATTGGVVKGTPVTYTGTGNWERIEVSWASDSTANYRLGILKNSDASTGVFYIDGAQCEAQTAASTYCDGDQDGCLWAAGPHASASTRSVQSRAGGQVINPQDYGFYITETSGIGMPGVTHRTQKQANIPGALYLGSAAQNRIFEIVGEAVGTSYANLHARRASLINLLKPNLVGSAQPILIRYNGSGTEVETRAVYDTGLDLNAGAGITEKIVIRFIGYDPFWYEIGETAAAITTEQTITGVNYMLAKVSNVWGKLGTGLNGAVYALAIGPDGYLYAGGNFTTAGGTTVNYVAKWDGSAWSALGSTPGTNGIVWALAFGPDGSLYAGGDFTSAGGTTVYYVAKWNGSAWAAVGSSPNVLNAAVKALVFGKDGVLYVGGDFTTYNTASYCYYIAKWNGTIWDLIGDGFSAAVTCLAVGPDGAIYAGGGFLTNHATDVTFNCIAKWNGTAWSALGAGMSGGTPVVNGLAVGADGTVYAGGNFTSAGGVSASYIAKYIGTAWSAMGTEIDGAVYDLYINQITGKLMAAGTSGWAQWNGSVWCYLDSQMPGAANAFAQKSNGDTYIGGDSNADRSTGYLNTVVNGVAGAASETWPVWKIKRSGGTSLTLKYLRNETTGDTVYFNYALLDGETLTIDFRPGRRSVTSDFFGPVWTAVERGGDFASFRLLPGSNDLMAWAQGAGTPTVTSNMVYRKTYWSVDG